MSNLEKVPLVQKLQSTAPAALANLPEVADRFQKIYSVMNGGNAQRAAIKYEAEKFHFAKLIQDKPELAQCTKLSLYGCFMDMAVNGLSFDPAMKHAYVVSFNINAGTKDQPKWEKRATLMISGYGELVIRMQQKQIKYADNPILVYDGDDFKHGTKDGRVFLEHIAAYPRKTDDIIACYVRLERIDGSVDYKVLSIEEVAKLRKFSKDPNSKAWTDGFPGMVQSKTMKHAFRGYPKVKLGQFSQLQSETVEQDDSPEILIDYGLNGSTPDPIKADNETPVQNGQYKATMIVTPADQVSDDDFSQPAQKQPAATVTHDDDDF